MVKSIRVPLLTALMILLVLTILETVAFAQDQPGYVIAMQARNNLVLFVERFEFHNQIGALTAPSGRIYVVMPAVVENRSIVEGCVYARNIRLVLDGQEYAPDDGLMGRFRNQINRDYVGPFSGHCVDGFSNIETFAVFETPLYAETAELKFFELQELVTIELAPGQIVPTSTHLITRATPTYAPGLYCIAGNEVVRVRNCQRGNCRVIAELQPGTQINVTATGLNASAWGDLLQIDVNGSAGYIEDEDAILCRGTTVIPSTATIVPTQPAISTPIPVSNGSPFGCNGLDDLNCTDFRAIGQNANAHLAQCGDEDGLDRDGDGRACEGG